MPSEIVYVPRKGTNSRKWDNLRERFSFDNEPLPLWIADMDFQAPQCVIDALSEYCAQGVYGYYSVPDEYFDAIIKWEKEHHGYSIEREWICFSPGVVAGFNWLLQSFTAPGDAVIIQTPVYYPFSEAVVNNARTLVESELVRTDTSYRIDLNDFEQKVIDNNVKAFIFCSPHNPCGRVWTKDEITKLLNICKKHGVIVLSDEIHQDILAKDYIHVPSATVGDFNDILVTISAPSKTFNVAGCQNSFIVIPDQNLRERYLAHTKELRINTGNPFGYIACTAAFNGGENWLSEVNDIIQDNYKLLKEKIQASFPKVWFAELQGTYLTWIDLGAYVSSEELVDFVINECEIAPDFGSWFGGQNSNTFIRINLATSKENIELAGQRIVDALIRKG